MEQHPSRRRRSSGTPGTRALCGLAIALAASTVAAADETKPQSLADRTLEELLAVEVATVYGASRHEQKVTDAPSSVTIITRDDIRTFGYRTLSEALRGVRGLYVTYDREYEVIGVRGFARPADFNTRVLLLIDGHRMNDNVYDQAQLGADFPLDIDMVERIEVIRGPGSALYGTSAFFGVVNVITRGGREFDGVELGAEGGSFGTWRARASAGRRLGGGGAWVASATGFRRDGPDLYFAEFDSPATNNGLTSGTDSEEQDSAYASLQKGYVTVSGLYGERRKGLPTGVYGTTFNDPRTTCTDTRAYADVQYRRQAWGDGEVLVRGFYDDYRYQGSWSYDEGTLMNRDEGVGRWAGSEALVSRRLHPRHRVTGGVEYRANLAQRQRNFDEDPYNLYLDDQRTSSQWAAYVQDEIIVHRAIQAVVGARYDRAGFSGDTVEPRLGMVFRPGRNTSVKALFGSAFRAPNAYEMFYGEASSKTNLALRPERLHTTEAVVEHYQGGLRLTATAYRSRIKDLIDQIEDPADGLVQFRNLDSVDAWGTDLEAEYRWRGGALVRANYAYQRAVDAETRDDLNNAPQHLAHMAGAWPFWRERATAAAEVYYVGSRLTLLRAEAPAYWLVNANVLGHLVPGKLDLAVGLQNLLNRRYWHPAGSEQPGDLVEQDGRTARVGLVVRF